MERYRENKEIQRETEIIFSSADTTVRSREHFSEPAFSIIVQRSGKLNLPFAKVYGDVFTVNGSTDRPGS